MEHNRIHKEKSCVNGCCGLCCTKIENFGVRVGNTTILRDINLHIHCGELTAIIGPNGAGKSTLLKAILGEVKHTGELKFMDANGSRSGSPMIGYVPQSLNFDRGSPVSVLDFFVSCKTIFPTWLYTPKSMINKVVESLKAAKADHLIDRRLGALSGGELQRVLLALALDPIPDLLLLDEPVSGVDQNGLELFYETVAGLKERYDLSIILVSHDLDLVGKYADRVVLLKETVVLSGKPDRVYGDEQFYNIFSLNWQSKFKNMSDKSYESDENNQNNQSNLGNRSKAGEV